MNIFEGKDILVTGGCGSIGSEIIHQLIPLRPARIRVFDHNEAGQFALGQKLNSPLLQHLIGDVRDGKRLRQATEGVDMIFHAAALKHVPLCEHNPFETINTNITGTIHVVEAAIANKVERLIGISTDKAVNPISIMGASKFISERLIINAPSDGPFPLFSCVRFGNVLDTIGSVVPTFRQQIQAGEAVTLTSPQMTRFFMTISDAAQLILQAITEMKGREIFVLKMMGLRIMDLAEVMIEELAPLVGRKQEDIPIKIIGIRPGEKLYEAIFAEEELPYITEKEKTFILRNSLYDNFEPQNGSHIAAPLQNYNSSNMQLISKEELRLMLKKEGIL